MYAVTSTLLIIISSFPHPLITLYTVGGGFVWLRAYFHTSINIFIIIIITFFVCKLFYLLYLRITDIFHYFSLSILYRLQRTTRKQTQDGNNYMYI